MTSPTENAETAATAMFKNLSTSTKLFILCSTFIVAIVVTIYSLVAEKQIAIEFARKELVGLRYLENLSGVYATVLDRFVSKHTEAKSAPAATTTLQLLKDAEAQSAGTLQTARLEQGLEANLIELGSTPAEADVQAPPVVKALADARNLASRVGDNSNLALDP